MFDIIKSDALLIVPSQCVASSGLPLLLWPFHHYSRGHYVGQFVDTLSLLLTPARSPGLISETILAISYFSLCVAVKSLRLLRVLRSPNPSLVHGTRISEGLEQWTCPASTKLTALRKATWWSFSWDYARGFGCTACTVLDPVLHIPRRRRASSSKFPRVFHNQPLHCLSLWSFSNV